MSTAMKVIGRIFTALFWLIINGVIVTARCTLPSGLAICAIAESPSAFTGTLFKNDGHVEFKTVRTEKCEQLDQKVENDGDRSGKVRWVECLSGPDCGEGLMY